MRFESRRHRARRAYLEAGFRPDWRDLLDRDMGHWRGLSPPQQTRLERLALALMADIAWEAARGFEVSDEIRLLVSAQAAVLGLGLADDAFRNVRDVLVHPTTVVLGGPHSQVAGLVSDDPVPVLGEAVFDGPLVLAWDAVLDDARHPGRGQNVVFHEFAHELDMLDGAADGIPPFPTAAERARFDAATAPAYEAVVAGEGGRSLRPYGGVNRAEFFAVATEAFFDVPGRLRLEHPDLYEALGGFYRQDPAERVTA